MPRLLFGLPHSLEGPGERIAFALLALSVVLVLVSVAASQILLGLALLWSLWSVRTGVREIWAHPVSLPLLCFAAWTIVAAIAAPGPLEDTAFLKKFFLFSLVYLVPWHCRRPGTSTWIYYALFGMAGLTSLAGILQFLARPDRGDLDRISGFMGHWMTYSGLQMLVLVAVVAYVLFGPGRRGWMLPLAILLVASLYLSATRNAWLGSVAGITFLLILRKPRAIWGLLALLVLAYWISPARFQDRFRAGFDPSDTTTGGRIELAATSVRLIVDNPWFGVGPQHVSRAALRYRGTDDFPDYLYQHMHNNFLQIAAERGLPGLLLWIWLMVRLAADAWKRFRSTLQHSDTMESSLVSATALGAWVALLSAGMLEYNFGDSEPLTLFLFMMSAPYASTEDSHTGNPGYSG